MAETPNGTERGDDQRTRIVRAASDLLARQGRDALTTRSVAAAAGVQAPILYRLFGDKRGLLDAVAEHGFARYLGEKAVRESGPDPVADLRAGWDLHIEFGLTSPALYALMFGDPRPGTRTPAAAASFRILREHVRRVALAGRLRVGEARAADMIHAAGSGTVFALLATPEAERDAGLSEANREAILGAVLTDAPSVRAPGPAAAAVALRAALPQAILTPGERGVLAEWLDRLADERLS